MDPDPGVDLVVRRVIPVARERVFAAWLDPASLAQWICPGDVRRATADIDPRVGGRFRIVMEHGRSDTEHWGEYLRIEPPSLISFTWVSANTGHRETIVTVELFDRGDGTELVLTHRRLPPAQADAHRRGWTDIVRKLAETIAGGQD